MECAHVSSSPSGSSFFYCGGLQVMYIQDINSVVSSSLDEMVLVRPRAHMPASSARLPLARSEHLPRKRRSRACAESRPRRVPVGVVGGTIPWSSPFALLHVDVLELESNVTLMSRKEGRLSRLYWERRAAAACAETWPSGYVCSNPVGRCAVRLGFIEWVSCFRKKKT